MSSIPVTTAAKPAAAVTFTAARVHALATEKAASACTSTSKCKACAGTGTFKLGVQIFGSAETTTSSLKCPYCKDGVVDTKKELYSDLIWCSCDAETAYRMGSIYAADGHKVFGNTTYLCRGCGFVSQFG